MFQDLKDRAIRILRWTERYTKTDMIYASRGSFWMLLAQFIYASSMFILAILFAHLISKDAYGTYQYVTSLIALLGALTLSGFEVALQQSVAKGYERIMRESFWIQVRWSIGASIASLAVGGYYLYHANYTIGIAMLAAAALSPFTSFTSTISAFFGGRKDFKSGALFSIAQSLLYATFMAVVLLLFRQPLWILLAYLVISAAVQSGLLLFAVWKYKPNSQEYPVADRLSKHVSLMNVLGALSSQLDSLTIFHFLGPVDLSIYSFAYAIPQQFESLIRIAYNLALPKFALMDPAAARQIVLRRTYQFVAVSIVIAALYVLIAPYIYELFFPAYIASIPYSRVLVLDFVLASLGSLSGPFMDSQVMIREKYILNLCADITKCVFIVLGGYYWGVWGVIIGILISMAFTDVVNLAIVYKTRWTK